MTRPILSLLGLVLFTSRAVAQEAPPQPAPLTVISAAEAFRDAARLAGKEVVISDGEIVFADQHGALLRSGDTIFFELKPDMAATTLRYLAATCAGPRRDRPGCRMPVAGVLLPGVSPTTGWPIISHARIGAE